MEANPTDLDGKLILIRTWNAALQQISDLKKEPDLLELDIDEICKQIKIVSLSLQDRLTCGVIKIHDARLNLLLGN